MSKSKKKEKEKLYIRLISDKKGALGSVMGSIGSFFQGLLQMMPKWLLYLLLIGVIVIVGTILTFIFNVFGIYCTSSDIPVSIGFNPLSTAELIGQVPDVATVGTNSIKVENPGFPTFLYSKTCSLFLNSGTIEFEDGSTQDFNNTWFYQDTVCVVCVHVKVYNYTGKNILIPITPEAGLCYGNVWAGEEYVSPLWSTYDCSEGAGGNLCRPPQDYFYDYTTNTYKCDETVTDCTKKTLGQTWDDILVQKGARPLYEDAYGEGREIKYDKFAQIRCRDARPRFTIYGIELFRAEYWAFLIIIVIGMWAIIKFKRK